MLNQVVITHVAQQILLDLTVRYITQIKCIGVTNVTSHANGQPACTDIKGQSTERKSTAAQFVSRSLHRDVALHVT